MKIIKKCRMEVPAPLRNQELTLQNYAVLIEPYERACKAIENRIHQMDWNYQERNQRSPIHSVESRVKSMNSIVEKLKRKNLENTCVNTVNRIGDIAGVRVICFYIAEVYELVEEIRHMKNIAVLKEKDYIKNPKGNGYRSYHLVIGAKIPGEEIDRYLPVEVQIRTIGMDWWASMEHQLCYKPMAGDDEQMVSDEMKRYSKRLYNLEKQMQKFYHPISAHIDEEKEKKES